ncbi:MAG: alpha/beta hydrolase [Ardenticatenaceae bacterium]|nr:alpha/beta hydrolase [Ardenticatenaceae bacterium]
MTQLANKPTLVLLHPGGVLHSVWMPFIRRWQSQYHILAPDLQPQQLLSISQLAAQVAALIQSETRRPVWLVGASLGANVALQIATTMPHQVAGLVLDSAQVGGVPPTAVRRAIQIVKILVKLIPQRLVTRLLLTQFKGYETADQLLIRQELNQVGKIGFINHIEAHFDYDVSHSLNQIQVPTLILAGEKDRLTQTGEPNKLQTGIPAAQLIIIPQAGHVTFLTEPARFQQAVTDFLLHSRERE